MDAFMQAALREALAARAQGGHPFGAALVRGDRIIGTGHNRMVQSGDPTSHAEIEAIRNAGRQETYADTVMYATALPCLMCAGAIVKLQIPKVIGFHEIARRGGGRSEPAGVPAAARASRPSP
jgi:creatinine deaminase